MVVGARVNTSGFCRPCKSGPTLEVAVVEVEEIQAIEEESEEEYLEDDHTFDYPGWWRVVGDLKSPLRQRVSL